MILGVLRSAYRMAQKPGDQATHPAVLRLSQASIWGKDLDNLPDLTSPGQASLHQPRDWPSSPIGHLP